MANPTKETFNSFQEELLQQFPFFNKHIAETRERLGEDWMKELDQELTISFGENRKTLRALARAYAMFTLDQIRLQQEFQKTRTYRQKQYEEAYSQVYGNRAAMKNYLPACLIASYLWPNLYQQLCFFRKAFAPKIGSTNINLVYDIGFGSGLYAKELLRLLPHFQVYGIDISPSSKEFAESLMERWHFGSRFKTEILDLTKSARRYKQGHIMSIELLEHLEHPLSLLGRIADLLDEGGYGFISAAITAAEVDHIYLYRDLNEIQSQLDQVHLETLQAREFAAYESSKGELVPRVGAFIVRKKR